jgi:hypothetical protein
MARLFVADMGESREVKDENGRREQRKRETNMLKLD